MPKFSFDNTVGELLSEPKVVEIIKEMFPELLSNPMMEMAKPFKLNDVLPYIEGMLGKEKIELFRKRLSEI